MSTVPCGFLNFLAGFFLFRMAGLADADDEGALCRFDHVVGDDGEVVDFHYSFDLWEEPFEEPEVDTPPNSSHMEQNRNTTRTI